jgi:glutamyl-tRNA reductase
VLVEPTLAVIGVNHRTARVEVRERFWMNEERRTAALSELLRGEGIEEVLVFSTCNRTEFVVWGDATLAANSVLRFLTAQYGLTLCEWRNFYRLLDEQALAHAFRVSCGLDSMRVGEGQIARKVNSAWQQARAVGSTGPCLDAILRKALAVRRRVRKETAIATCLVSAPRAAVELAGQLLGSLAHRDILLFGTGRASETAAQCLLTRGAESVCVMSRTDQHALDLAARVGIQACAFEERWTRLAAADLVISATASPEFILRADHMKPIAAQRQNHNLVLMDLGLPRNVDPAVRELGGVILYDLDDLEPTAKPQPEAREAELQAEKIVLAEVQSFKKELMGEGATPAIAALRHRLDEICQQELESFRLEQGPFPKDQDQLIAAVSARITHKIAGSLARRAGSWH